MSGGSARRGWFWPLTVCVSVVLVESVGWLALEVAKGVGAGPALATVAQWLPVGARVWVGAHAGPVAIGAIFAGGLVTIGAGQWSRRRAEVQEERAELARAAVRDRSTVLVSPGALPVGVPDAVPVGWAGALAARVRGGGGPVVVCGPRGAGKTVTVAQVARDARAEGAFGLVLWVPCAGRVQAERYLAGALSPTGVFGGDDASAAAQAREVVSRLDEVPGGVLVVFDGVSDVSVLEGLVPQGPRCRVVVTTRDPLVASRPGWSRMTVGAGADPLVATGWLAAQIAGAGGTGADEAGAGGVRAGATAHARDVARVLVSEVGGHVLGLDQVRRAVASPRYGMSPAERADEVAARMVQGRGSWDDSAEGAPGGYPHTYAQALRVGLLEAVHGPGGAPAWWRVDRRVRDRAGRRGRSRVLGALALAGGARVRLPAVAPLAGVPGMKDLGPGLLDWPGVPPAVAGPAGGAGDPRPHGAGAGARGAVPGVRRGPARMHPFLAMVGVVTGAGVVTGEVDDRQVPYLRLVPAVGALVRGRLRERGEFGAAVRRMVTASEGLLGGEAVMGRPDERAQVLEHAPVVQGLVETVFEQEPGPGTPTGAVLGLAARTSGLLVAAGRPGQGLALAARAGDVAATVLGPDDPHRIPVLLAQARARAGVGEAPGAVDDLGEVLRIATTMGEDPETVAVRLGAGTALIGALTATGDTARARAVHATTLQLLDTLQGPRGGSGAGTVPVPAGAARVAGTGPVGPDDTDPSALVPVEHLRFGLDLALAHLELAAGRKDTALEHFTRLESTVEDLFQGPHPLVTAARTGLADALQSTGQIEAAIEARRIVVKRTWRHLGAQHGDTIEAELMLAEARARAGRPHSAVKTAEWLTVPELYEQLDPRHRLRARLLVAQARRSPAGPGDAAPVDLSAFDGVEALIAADLAELGQDPGADARLAVKAVNDHGCVLKEHGDLAGAETELRRALTDAVRLWGMDDADTLTTLNNLAITCKAAGKLTEAAQYYRRALTGRTRLHGADDPRTVATRTGMTTP